MARIIINTPHTRIEIPGIDNKSAAEFVDSIDDDFRIKGGAWIGAGVAPEGTPEEARAAMMTWVPRTSQVQVTFDGPTMPQKAREVLIAE